MSASGERVYKTIKDLPIYEPHALDKSKQSIWVVIDRNEKSELEKIITNFRQGTCDFLKQFNQQKQKSIEYIDSTKQSVNKQLEYVRSETNVLPKIVFISLSGFGGLLIGFRRSTARKIFYSSVLATATTALCYPKEAKEYSTQAAEFTRIHANKFYRTYIWPDTKKPISITKQPAVVRSQENSKDQVIKLDKEALKSSVGQSIDGDKGQSNDADKDMYTTRSSK